MIKRYGVSSYTGSGISNGSVYRITFNYSHNHLDCSSYTYTNCVMVSIFDRHVYHN